MEVFSAAPGSKLFWVQPRALEREFELRSECGLCGRLRFEKALGTLATADSAQGRWTLKRSGFLNPRVTIRKSGRYADVAVFWPKLWGGGWVDFADGNRFQWKSFNFWGTAWGFAGVREELLFTMKPGAEKTKLSDLLKTQAVVEIVTHPDGLAEMPLLIMLGWYLMIMQQEYSATAAAVIS